MNSESTLTDTPTIVVRAADTSDETALAYIDRVTWSPTITPSPEIQEDQPFFEPGRELSDTLVAIADGEIAGYVCFGDDIPLPCHSHVLELKGLAVHPVHQRKGIGRILMEAAILECSNRGATKIKSRVLSTNPASLHLHEVLGFHVEGTLRKEFFLNDTFVDDVQLALVQ